MYMYIYSILLYILTYVMDSKGGAFRMNLWGRSLLINKNKSGWSFCSDNRHTECGGEVISMTVGGAFFNM